jgi:hypothetical protein
MVRHRGRDALAAAQPGADELICTGAVGLGAGGQREARRVLQAIGRTPPGSWTVVYRWSSSPVPQSM